jgi:hypothetical protein
MFEKEFQSSQGQLSHRSNLNNKSSFKTNYTANELENNILKPSKKFNHPNGKSRQPFKVTSQQEIRQEVVQQNKMMHTSSMIKNLRDFKSSLSDITGSRSSRGDQKDVLRYNLKNNDFEYSQPRREPLQIRTRKFDQNTEHSNPIVASTEKPRYRSSKRMRQSSTFNSQIVLGEEQSNAHLKSQSRITYCGLTENKENVSTQNYAKYLPTGQSYSLVKPSGLKTLRAQSAKGQKPQQVTNAFQSQIMLS